MKLSRRTGVPVDARVIWAMRTASKASLRSSPKSRLTFARAYCRLCSPDPGVHVHDGRLLPHVAQRPAAFPVEIDVRHVVALVRERDVHVERFDLGRERGAERPRRDRVAGAVAVLDGRSVGQDHRQPVELELLGGEGSLVDLDVEDAPVVRHGGAQALGREPLVIAVELLEVVLRDEQPLRPDELPRLHCGAPGRGGVAGVDGGAGACGVAGVEGGAAAGGVAPPGDGVPAGGVKRR